MKDNGYTKIDTWRCNHCMEFHAINEDIIKEHINECMANPDNKACIMCKNIMQFNDVENEQKISQFECIKKNVVLEEVDLSLMDATCYEERLKKEVPNTNSKAYEKYLSDTVKRIENNINAKLEV